MKRLLARLLPVVGSMLALVAVIGVRPACVMLLYQPEVPSALVEE
ncbi:MAG: cyclic lactone autoinducer peptide [Clostridia bacterium]|nr:cyclic lactone autoinducer peptide [Clostridia bacterium]MDH7573145.1 cyclic lactone autoinducer peptide [Clostridia bacterium]